MNKKNTDKLYKDFPKLYRGHTKDIEISMMRYGFQCDDGWFDLLYDLSAKISQLNEKAEVFQVKQKFGELRFSLVEFDDSLAPVISSTVEKSKSTCEVCGLHGSALNKCGRHLIVLCKKCSSKGYGGFSCIDAAI